jgi:hypothetical protein
MKNSAEADAFLKDFSPRARRYCIVDVIVKNYYIVIIVLQ